MLQLQSDTSVDSTQAPDTESTQSSGVTEEGNRFTYGHVVEVGLLLFSIPLKNVVYPIEISQIPIVQYAYSTYILLLSDNRLHL